MSKKKNKRWDKEAPPRAALVEKMRGRVGEGVSTKFEDAYPEVPPDDLNGPYYVDPEQRPWLDAFFAAGRDDYDPLIELLRSDAPMPAAVRGYVADLIKQRLKPRRGGPLPTPSWDLTPAQRKLEAASQRVYGLVHPRRGRGMSVAEAQERVSTEDAVPLASLARYYKDRVLRPWLKKRAGR